jgi:hypothetical protein
LLDDAGYKVQASGTDRGYRAFKDGTTIYADKTQVGTINDPTPVFSAVMTTIVFNPEEPSPLDSRLPVGKSMEQQAQLGTASIGVHQRAPRRCRRSGAIRYEDLVWLGGRDFVAEVGSASG